MRGRLLCLKMAALLVAGVVALLGYPQNFGGRFFESVNYAPMGQPGVYDSNILNYSNETLQIRCQGSGVICVGGFESLSQGERHSGFGDRWDVRRQTNDVLTVHLGTTGGVGVSVVCARYGVTWRHASWSLSSGTYDVFGGINKSVDFLVVGGGVGGWAAAAALRGESDVALVRPPNTVSTTELSSGVMWFPSPGKHTPEVLRNATGTSQFDDILTKYAQSGEEDRQYWDDLIGLKPWPSAADPVWDYMGVTRNRSFVLSECTIYACGSPTVTKLQGVSNADVVDGVAVSVKSMPDRRLVVDLATPASRIVTRYLVVATGGGGYHSNQTTYDGDVTLARPENTGFQLNVSAALNLTTVGHNAYYHLEWKKPTNGSWEVRWFPTDLCKPNSSCVNASYSLCSDYSKRAQSYIPGAAGCSAVAVDASFNQSCSSAEEWWRKIVPINFTELCTAKLQPGIIDGKVGFKLGPDFCSFEDERICASGTTAAAFSHNAYFAPGATIGLAMSTGRAVATALSTRNRERKEQSAVAQGYRDTLAPTLFLIGLWVVFVGVLCKSASRGLGLRSLVYGHYVLMPLGAAVVTAGVFVAATQPRKVMRDYSKPHVVVGYITVVLMWIQVLAGILVQSQYTPKRGRLHRVSGSILLGMMAYLYIGATVPPTPLERYHPTYTEPLLQISGIVWALVLGGVVCTGFVSWSSPKSNAGVWQLLETQV
jgi:hypothetical protein